MPESRSFLFSISENISNEYLENARASGIKFIGYFCSYVPEELLGVKGLSAFRMRAKNTTTTEVADAYLGAFNCTYTRCLLEAILNNEYGFLDGFVFAASCDHLRRLYDNIQYAVSPNFCHILDLPHKSHKNAIDWYAGELSMLRDALASYFGLNITDTDLAEAVRQSNENRRLLAAINELRKLNRPPITGEEMQRLMVASFSLPKAKVMKS
ncbi:MAG: 2-hydroxyacyl-CoA dehydratase [Deltaproteobacteria bacterium]|nr:MAG: 2-hydroxyacyl-CoA dehydratase [Deltaproteobacteria bacterium]